MTYLETFRRNLQTLHEAFIAATGCGPSVVGKKLLDDPKFFQSCMVRDFQVGTYDYVLARFSHEWPAGTDWPAGINRPAGVQPREKKPRKNSKLNAAAAA